MPFQLTPGYMIDMTFNLLSRDDLAPNFGHESDVFVTTPLHNVLVLTSVSRVAWAQYTCDSQATSVHHSNGTV
jgi:hypothetical protein